MRRNPARPAYKPVTDSAAFRRWFGASNVVDADGEPLVVYHGTTATFENGMFDTFFADTNAKTGVPDAFFFSSNADVAATYATTPRGRYRAGANVLPVYLRLEKPLVVDLDKWAGAAFWNDIPYRRKTWTMNDLARHAMRRGYDGLIVKRVRDVHNWDALRGPSSVGNTYVAFDPQQVKSATGNVGTFDRRELRIAHNPSRRRNGVSAAHRAEKPDAVVMDPKRMARVFIENPKVRQTPARQNPASKETFLEGVERRSKRKGKAERAVGKAQIAQGGAVFGMAVAKKAAPLAALRLGATVGGRAIPVVGEVLMVVGAGKEAYKVGKRRLKGERGSWKTDLAKVGAGAVGLEDFVPEAEKSEKLKKNPRRPTTAERTDPVLWEAVKREVTAGSKGGVRGEWSARKAQLSVALYKQRGGGYLGPKSPQNALAKWTREDWRTRSGKPSLVTGERYLPARAIEALTPAEYAATTRAKRAGLRRDEQFTRQPERIAAKAARYRENPTGREAEAIRAIRANLTPDLLAGEYRACATQHPMAGHCSVATEALYFMLGGKAAGYTPMNVRHEGVSHWYLRTPDNLYLDPTADQFDTPVDYASGRGRGFPTPRQGRAEPPPSKRAETLLGRIGARKR